MEKFTLMENQPEDSAGIETDEFPDEFQCCVCLDIFYKPVVLACGHISCFWCIFQSMDSWKGSHCPVCRHSYNHFPSICQLLHVLLLKLYPLAYERRERQVREEEKKSESFSPQFDDYLAVSHTTNESDIVSGFSPHSTTSQNKLYLESRSSVEGESSSIKDLPEVVMSHDDKTMTIPITSSYKATRDVTTQGNSMLEKKSARGSINQVLITDLLCAACKQLLCRPVVLNCGHVYCEACLVNLGDEVCSCQICHSMHPNGFPKVCLVLEHFLEKHFSEEYAARKDAVLRQPDCHHVNRLTCPTQAQKHAAELSSISTNAYLLWLSGQGPKVHVAVGCDFCGMYPIVGERYKCKDCTEKMGFDLCEKCYKSSSKLPGRFNQHHTPEHKFEIEEPVVVMLDHLLWRLGTAQPEEVSDDADGEDVSPPISSDETLLNPEDGPAAPISSDENLQDRDGDGTDSRP
ncbi:E3 ubiquitin-protein ligase PRT1 [Cornus florida]|uniref:E3 ubiquitin-protein ligase PRT1 n=1 Tax=Cornus florida TaxID=4283 RepID=UPI002897E470|nr:E3 ubiquitin-protein ligase PRT1 [Cornus florida]